MWLTPSASPFLISDLSWQWEVKKQGTMNNILTQYLFNPQGLSLLLWNRINCWKSLLLWFTMLSLLFFSLSVFSDLWSFVCAKTITGLPCNVTDTTGAQLPGIYVPLYNNCHSWDCSDLFGFLVLDVCVQRYRESMQNIHLLLLHPLLILKVCLLCINSVHVIRQRRKGVLQAKKWILQRPWFP